MNYCQGAIRISVDKNNHFLFFPSPTFAANEIVENGSKVYSKNCRATKPGSKAGFQCVGAP